MSIGRRTWLAIGAIVVVIALAFGVFTLVQRATTRTITAYFPSVTGLYAGDPVRVIGVNVGKVTSIEPRSRDVRVVLRIDDSVSIPADARAVIVAQSLVSGRFVQLTPAYVSGAQMGNNADIPMERTAVPMEWDDVKKQLSELSEAMGPTQENGKTIDKGTFAKAVDVAAQNLDGNGQDMAEAIRELSTVTGTLSDNRSEVFATIKSLQQLTGALANSHEQLMQFNGRMATVSQVLAGSGDELSTALGNLNDAIAQMRTFLDRNSGVMTDMVDKLSRLTGTLKNKDEQIRGLLHSSPTQLSNFYNIYNPLTGSLDGVFGLGMGNNLITLLCGTLASTNRPMNSEADVEQCVDLIGPVLKDIVVNYPPFLANPVIGKAADPDQITYQNSSVKQRAQTGVQQRDAASRKSLPDPLTDLLVPWGGSGR